MRAFTYDVCSNLGVSKGILHLGRVRRASKGILHTKGCKASLTSYRRKTDSIM